MVMLAYGGSLDLLSPSGRAGKHFLGHFFGILSQISETCCHQMKNNDGCADGSVALERGLANAKYPGEIKEGGDGDVVVVGLIIEKDKALSEMKKSAENPISKGQNLLHDLIPTFSSYNFPVVKHVVLTCF